MESATFIVVRNHRNQYSTWFDSRPMPDGWESAGFKGSKEECLQHIEKVWTDLTPRTASDQKRDQAG
ncbi:MbtH family protein [Kribbella sp. WER1]